MIPHVANCQQPNITIIFKGVPVEKKEVILSEYNPYIDSFNRIQSEVINGECKLTFYRPTEGIASFYNLQYLNLLYFTPGDSIECHFKKQGSKNPILFFSGKNAANYNLYSLLYADTSLIYPRSDNKKYADLQLFLTDFENCYERRKVFMSDYFKVNNISASCKNFIQGDFYFEYLRRLLSEKNRISSTSVLQKRIKEVSNDSIFQRDDLIKSREYTIVLLKIYLQKYLEGGLPANQNIVTHYKEILKSRLSGLSKEYLLTSFIKYYTKRGYPSDYSAIDSIVNVLNKEFKSKEFLHEINNAFINYKKAFIPLADSVLNEELESLNGAKLKFKDIINRYKGKPIYLDFWASWCNPCKMDITSNEAIEMEKLGKSKDVVFINISLDKTKNQSKWLNVVKTLPLDPDYQYRLINSFESPLVKYFNIPEIPHYVFLFKDGKTRIEDAPRITETKKLKILFDK